jgi:dye decolorizing peroxidase
MTVPRRRDVLRGLAAAGLGAAAGVAGGWAVAEARPFELPRSDDSGGGTGVAGAPVDPHGPYQAGIARPTTPQSHGVMAVLDLADTAPALTGASDFVAGLQALCALLGEAITALTSPGGSSAVDSSGAELLDGPGDLTVTVGIGPRLVRAVDPSLPGAVELPRFASDDGLTADRIGGDILLAAYSSNPNDADHAVRWLASRVSGAGASLRWSQRLFRGPGNGTVTRNPLGFHDGIIVPHGDTELDQHVWIPEGPLAGGTICVVRRLRLDSSGFHGESQARQEAIIGRRRHDGSPLSGGERDDEVDLLAKSPDGQYVVPARSHVRAAHPSFTGSALMLRRGYAFDDGSLGDDPNIRDAGLMFTCFQRELRTFVQTQHRLDETDDLMGYATPTASATFLILPGFTPDRPLGSALS